MVKNKYCSECGQELYLTTGDFNKSSEYLRCPIFKLQGSGWVNHDTIYIGPAKKPGFKFDPLTGKKLN